MVLPCLFIAGAVSALVSTGVPPGPAGNYCHLTWDKQCCPVPGCNVSIAPGILTICNEKPDPAEFSWELIDTSGLGLQFLPQSGIASPGNSPIGAPTICIDIPFTVICPPNFPVGSVATYEARIIKVGTNEIFSCSGNVVNHSDWKIDPAGTPVIDVLIPVDATQEPVPSRGQLVVSNIGSSGKDGVSIDLMPMGPFTVVPNRLNIPPIPPGGSWSVDSFYHVTFDFARRGTGQSEMGDILFLIDTTGDGVGDTVIGSQTVRGLPTPASCASDINGDGVTDTADLGILIGRFGTFCPAR